MKKSPPTCRAGIETPAISAGPDAQRTARQHLGLNQARELELAAQAFLFHRRGLVPLEILRHLVERAGEGAEFVAGPHRDAGVEVAAGELTDAARERREMLRHAVRDGDDADEGQGDDQHAEPEVAHRRAPDFAQRLADRPGDPENDSRRAPAARR